ncbi:pyrroline-5-carboxylate reductase [Patescibacteria group bacterium]|nr:pyrroline-5-carboxylate reductase [Patescibacteria group bacterium]
MKNITIIGTGTMGKIFLQACQKVFSDSQITATVKSDESVKDLKQDFPSINFSSDNKLAVENSDLVILAVKPQSFLEVAKEMRGSIKQDALVISVMAGVSLEKIKNELGVEKIVRTMPNLGARVGKSMTVWTSSDEISVKEKELVIKLLRSIGKELEVGDDEKIDKATAVSGSGPGFFFAVVEEWLEAVGDLGFSEEEAKLLLLQTIDGANDLLQKDGKATELRQQVASKGGTTEAGLKVLRDKNLNIIFREVLQASLNRAGELTK